MLGFVMNHPMVAIAKSKVSKFFKKENGEVSIVAMVILIGIAVVLAILFRDRIKALLDSLFGQVEEKAEGIFDN